MVAHCLFEDRKRGKRKGKDERAAGAQKEARPTVGPGGTLQNDGLGS